MKESIQIGMGYYPQYLARVRRQLCAAITFVLASLLSACVVGPDYIPPKLSVPATFVEAPKNHWEGLATVTQANDTWWKNFDDPSLDRLIAEALKTAPSIAEAEARVWEARAMRGIVGADQLPIVDADGLYGRNHGSNNVPVGVPPGGLGPGINSNLWQSGFDASWELDVFGGQRRAIQSADATYAAVVEDRSDVVLTLLAEIVRDYVELRGAQRRIELARKNLDVEEDTQKLTRTLLNSGLAPRQDLLRAQALVASTEADMTIFETDERVATYRLAALIGCPPAEIVAELAAPQPIPQAINDVPVGLPSDLLLRRPDVRAAERRVAAANARIGVAQADLYPHFSLTGVIGLESLNLSSFTTASSGYYSIGPSVNWRIFDAGRIHFQVLAESARTDAAAAAYQRSVMNALRDVETALVSYAKAKVRHDKLVSVSEASKEVVNNANLLYKQGVEDFLPVLDAERTLYESDDKLAQSERDTALALVALYKSLGGGW